MAEELTNGTSAPAADVEMKEEVPAEVAPSTYAARLHEMLIEFQTNLSNVQPPPQEDPTDPNPPPQAESINPAVLSNTPEHLSTIQPAAPAVATPPAASNATARPGSMPPQPAARPEKPVAHGGPTRQFLNANITPHLLEGMKYLAVYEPEKPLLWLSDFLRDRSKEVEGS